MGTAAENTRSSSQRPVDGGREADRRLAFADLDALLGLPSGTARRRRLFVVTAHASLVGGTPFRPADRLVLEPGVAIPLGRFVACRKGRSLALYGTSLTRRGDVVLVPTARDELPLPFPNPTNVIGVAIGAIRRSRGRCLVAVPPSYDFIAERLSRSAGAVTERLAVAREVEDVLLALERIASELNDRRPAEARSILAAAFRIRTLHRCMQAVGGHRLYEALATEIDRIVGRMDRRLHAHGISVPRLRGSVPLGGPAVIDGC